MDYIINKRFSWFALSVEVGECRVSEDFSHGSSDAQLIFERTINAALEIGECAYHEGMSRLDFVLKVMEIMNVELKDLQE